MNNFHNQAQVSNQAGTQNVYGDLHFHTQSLAQPTKQDAPANYRLGLRLGSAPRIDRDHFIGREQELQQLRTWLQPQPSQRSVVAVHGLGGMGKTQLVLRFAQQSTDVYSSTFWLNAKDESTIKASLVELARQTAATDTISALAGPEEERRLIQQAQRWLSLPDNHQWLLIFDNYDDPRLPGLISETGYDIRPYFPDLHHGSILITTRSPRLSFAKQLKLSKLVSLRQSLDILSSRSGRVVEEDSDAYALARRFDGLPLALASAGTYLGQTGDTFAEYLELYNGSWNDLVAYSDTLLDYEGRTLASTWNLTYSLIKAQDPAIAQLLRLLAYFDNHDMWWELFRAGAHKGPEWWQQLVSSKLRFSSAMAKLHSHSLVEVSAGTYSLHTCVHDWIMQHLNAKFDDDLWQLVVECVATSAQHSLESGDWSSNHRLLLHAERINHILEGRPSQLYNVDPKNTDALASLFWRLDRLEKAEQMYRSALQGHEKLYGRGHVSSLRTLSSFSLLCRIRNELAESVRLRKEALRCYEKARTCHYEIACDSLLTLSLLAIDEGNLDEAEEILLRALQACQATGNFQNPQSDQSMSDADHKSSSQHKSKKEDQIRSQATPSARSPGPRNAVWLPRIYLNLGDLYRVQQEYLKAEQMLQLALRGLEEIHGPDDRRTLVTVILLGDLYKDSARPEEAQQMYLRVFRSYEKTLGHYGELPVLGMTHFKKVLVQCALAQTPPSLYHNHYILVILEHIRAPNEEGYMYGSLARMLIEAGDEQNARMALQQQTFTYSSMRSKSGVMCDGCDRLITYGMDRFVCKQCVDVDLCRQCFEAHTSGTQVVSTCQGHCFFEASPESSPAGPMKLLGDDQKAVKLWLDEMVKKYSSA